MSAAAFLAVALAVLTGPLPVAGATLPDAPVSGIPQTQGGGSINSIAVAGTVVYVGGGFTSFGGQPRGNLAAFDMQTGQVLPWNPNANDTVNELFFQGDSVYVGGKFTQVGGASRAGLARVAAAGPGNADPGWNPANLLGGPVRINALAMSGGEIYFGGEFTTPGATTGLAKADLASGTLGAWVPSVTGAAPVVNDLVVAESNVFVAGSFSTVNVTPRNGLAKVGTAGTGDVRGGWNPDPNSAANVRALVLAGGDLYVGGQFSAIGGVSRNNLARVAAAGSGALDPGWNPDANSEVRALALRGPDLMVGGGFTAIGGKARARLAMLDPTGKAMSWSPAPDATVQAIARMVLPPPGTAAPLPPALVGGSFQVFGSGSAATLSRGFALFPDIGAPQSISPPTISGSARVKETLTCGPGTWSPPNGVPFTYEWLRNGSPIAQVVTPGYTVTSDDAGAQLACRVTATTIGGSATATSESVTVAGASCAEDMRPRARLTSSKLGKLLRKRNLGLKLGASCAGTVRVRLLTTGMRQLVLASERYDLPSAGSKTATLDARSSSVRSLRRIVRDQGLQRVEVRLVVKAYDALGTAADIERRREVLRQ